MSGAARDQHPTHQAIDVGADLLATANRDGYFTSLNEAWEQVLGWSRAELMTRPFIQYIHPDDVTATMQQSAGVNLPDFTVDGFENRYKVKGGGWRWLRWYARTDGQGWIAVAFDVTEARGRADRLRRALDDGRLCAYSQPIISPREHGARAEELLARLAATDDYTEATTAAEFIETAEESGLIVEIDVFMVGEALRVATPDRTVHVNLSVHTISDAGARAMILEAVALRPDAAQNLIIEVTESAALAGVTTAREFAESLAEHGVRLALDDFGTRFASLEHLRRLPVRTLKIDISFIRNLVSEEADQRLVRSIVAIARELELDTIAEGVENPQTLELLRSYGVDQVQGFYLGEPAPLAG